MNKVRSGDIIFFRTELRWNSPMSWLSAIIRMVAGIRYNHVGTIVYIWGIPMVYESVGRGYIATPLRDRIKDYSNDNLMVLRPRYKKFNEVQLATEATKLLGKIPYDIRGLILDQFVWNIFGVWIGKRREEAATKMYCYESVAYLHRRSERYKEWWRVLPKECDISDNEFILINTNFDLYFDLNNYTIWD